VDGRVRVRARGERPDLPRRGEDASEHALEPRRVVHNGRLPKAEDHTIAKAEERATRRAVIGVYPATK